MAGILIADTLKVESDIGECQIQLCVGDITTLPKEDGVDILVISAFPGRLIENTFFHEVTFICCPEWKKINVTTTSDLWPPGLQYIGVE